MATRVILPLALWALLVGLAAAQSSCAGPAAPAKYRYLFLADVKDDSPANVKGIEDAYGKWIKSCGDMVVREGHAPAITQDPTMFGFKGPAPNNSFVGDFAGWSDWKSLEDLRACIAKGLKDGSVTATRSYAVRAARIVLSLDSSDGLVAVAKGRKDCKEGSFAPAKVRMMMAYVLKDPNSVPRANTLHHKLVEAINPQPIRYGTGGRSALGKDEYMWGPGITKTADWGVWNDFASEADVRAYFNPANTDAAARKVRAELRSLYTSAIRVAIPLA